MPGGTEEVWQASGASPYYRHADWLGSSRFASTYSTRAMYNDLAYAPFGETYAATGSAGVTDISFAGNNEDTTTNLYDAQFREYGIQGRWPSPDPAGIAAVDPANPQSWNRYAYVLNEPLTLSDRLGLLPAKPNPNDPTEGLYGNCTLDGVPVSCTYAEVVANGGGGINLSNVELYLTGGIPVPGAAYDPNDPSNPLIAFGLDNNLYVDGNLLVGIYTYDSFAALVQAQQQQLSNLQNMQASGSAPTSSQLSQAAVQGVQLARPIANPCVVAGFYAVSATAGAAANAPSLFEETKTLVASIPTSVVSWVQTSLYRQTMTGTAAYMVVKVASAGASKIASGCRAME